MMFAVREHVMNDLRVAIKRAGSQKAFAKNISVSEQFICDVLKGRREPTGRLLTWLGYEAVVLYATLERKGRR